jgi:predicted N-acetyltransferase YhbS
MRTIVIRPAAQSDFSALRDIELAAFETLRDAGAVDGEASASTVEQLQQYLDRSLLLVACASDGVVRGWCGGYEIDGWLHIAEIDVHPDWQLMGIGRQLIHALLDEGKRRGLCGATLTTDRIAAFNAPFYQSFGFRFLAQQDSFPRLEAILEAEVGAGLNPLRRVAMVVPFEVDTR